MIQSSKPRSAAPGARADCGGGQCALTTYSRPGAVGRLLAVALTLVAQVAPVPALSQRSDARDYRQRAASVAQLRVSSNCVPAHGAPAGVGGGLFELRGATRFRDGRTAVLSGGTFELIVFDSSGRRLAHGGRRGPGPGEFASDQLLMFPYRGDSLLVYEIGSRRISVFDDRARFGRTLVLTMSGDVRPLTQVRVAGTTISDGSFAVSYQMGGWGQSADLGTVVRRDSVAVVWFDAAGRQRGPAQLAEDALVATDRRRGNNGGTRVRIVTAGPVSRASAALFLGTQSTVAVVAGRAFHVEERTETLVIQGPGGRPERRLPLPPLSASQRPSEDPRGVVARSQAQILETRAGTGDVVWVELARSELAGERRWAVFTDDGQLIAEVRGPRAGRAVLEVGRDYVLTVERDADDMERVAYCPLRPM